MKILLVCIPRTGSNSILKALAKSYNIPRISIPDVYSFPKDISLISYVLSKKDLIFRLSPNHNVGYSLEEFSSYFDNVILLSRKNDKKHYESILNLYYREHVLGFNSNTSYDYNDIPESIKIDIDSKLDWQDILLQKKQLEVLGRKLDLEILYYEDVFYSDIGTEVLSKTLPEFNREKFDLVLSETKKSRLKRKKMLI